MSHHGWRLALSLRLKLGPARALRTNRTALLRGTTALGDAGQAEETWASPFGAMVWYFAPSWGPDAGLFEGTIPLCSG